MATFGLTNKVFNYFGNHSPRVITGELDAAATGKRFVSIVAGGADQMPRIAQTTAGAAAQGVLDGDGAAGDRRAFWQTASGISVTAGAALTAGTRVVSDAEGRAVPYDGTAAPDAVILGTVLSDAALDEDAVVQLAL